MTPAEERLPGGFVTEVVRVGSGGAIEAGADRGEPAMLRLRAAGVPPMIHGWHDWLSRRSPKA